jgi:hypothetical protein
MAGLVPAIHVFLAASAKDVDTRDKPGHDGASNDEFPLRSGGACAPSNCQTARRAAILRSHGLAISPPVSREV